MDFMSLLSVAQSNKSSNQPTAYYATKFTPPKKETKQSKDLSRNIQKFLSKREEEEKRKAIEENKKKQHLLALRDEKAQKRINKHLKACKDSNKAVLEDAIDNKNTAITMPGSSAIVTDDYGYVSQEASAFYDKLMNKYNSMPAEKPLFSSSGKKTVKDIELTKERVKEALKHEKSEESRGHRRKSKAFENSQEDEEESVSHGEGEVKQDEKERSSEKLKSKKKAMPPSINFAELLKLAEQKQHEPIVVKVKPKPKEPEKLLTKKEYVKEQEWLQKKEDRRRGLENPCVKKTPAVDKNKIDKKIGSKAEISNGIKKISTEKDSKFKSSETVKKPVARSDESSSSKSKNIEKVSKECKDKGKDVKNKYKDELLEERRKLEMERRKLEEMRRSIEEEKKKLSAAKEKNKIEQKSSNLQSTKLVNKIGSTSTRESEKGIVKSGKDKILAKHKNDIRMKKPTTFKRRAIFDDEDEYDSELDDFIADEPEEEQDVSKYISEIFGYDRSKYRDIDEDDSAMESNFAQQLKEEFISTKTGIMEDLEDIRKEAWEKKRKAMLKKKRKI